MTWSCIWTFLTLRRSVCGLMNQQQSPVSWYNCKPNISTAADSQWFISIIAGLASTGLNRGRRIENNNWECSWTTLPPPRTRVPPTHHQEGEEGRVSQCSAVTAIKCWAGVNIKIVWAKSHKKIFDMFPRGSLIRSCCPLSSWSSP